MQTNPHDPEDACLCVKPQNGKQQTNNLNETRQNRNINAFCREISIGFQVKASILVGLIIFVLISTNSLGRLFAAGTRRRFDFEKYHFSHLTRAYVCFQNCLRSKPKFE